MQEQEIKSVMNKKVLLVCLGLGINGFRTPKTNTLNGEFSWIHHGLAMLGACLKQRGHEVQLVDMRKCYSWVELLTKINEFKPDYVGISISYIDHNFGLRCINVIKKSYPNLKIIVGGLCPTSFPDEFVSNDKIDFVVTNEGEIVLPDIVEGKITQKLVKGIKPDVNLLPFADRELYEYDYELMSLFTPGQLVPSITMISGRGCPYKCRYCFDGDTLVMMGDLSHKKIKDLKIGDSIIGFNKVNRRYKPKITKIKSNFSRNAELYLVETDRGNFKSTSEHPFLSYNNHNRWRKLENLKVGDKIHYFCNINNTIENEEYKTGYIAGVVCGDGYIGKYSRKRNRKTYYYNVRVAGDFEMLDVWEKFCKDLNIKVHHHKFNGGKIFYNLNRAVGGYSIDVYNKINSFININNPTDDYKIGFLAGMLDSDGSNSGNTIRFHGIDLKLMNRVKKYLSFFGFKTIKEKESLRIIGNSYIRNSLISLLRPKVPRKNKLLLGNSPATIKKIKKIGISKVFNISTGTENFVANGFVTHNCQPAENKVYGKGSRHRNVDNVMQELNQLYDKYKYRNITWWDDTFTFDKNWVADFCDKFRKSGIKAEMQAYSRADIICNNEGMVKDLASIGCKWLVIGFENGNQRILDLLDKGTTVEQNIKSAEICRKYGIKVFGLFMFGLPTETNEETYNTYKMIKEINPEHKALFYFTPIPGTHIFQFCKDNDLILRNEKDIFNIDRTSNYTPKMRGIDYKYLDSLREDLDLCSVK